ncbi:MAG: DNA translocase FtsK [Clostridia bacterium]|nr:DNA translocase FtsK [Clostridia bacterium]
MGAPAYFMPILAATFMLHHTIKGSVNPHLKTYICLTSALILLSILATINASDGNVNFLNSDNSSLLETVWIDATSTVPVGGGLIGALGIPVMSFFGVLGSQLLIIFSIIMLVSFATGNVVIAWIIKGFKLLWSFVSERFEAYQEDKASSEAKAAEKEKKLKKPAASKKAKDEDEDVPEASDKDLVQVEFDFDNPAPSRERIRVKKTETPEKEEEEITTPQEPHDAFGDMKINVFLEPEAEDENEANVAPSEDAVPTVTIDIAPEEEAPAPVKKVPNVAIELKEDDFIVDTKPYEFPPITLLDKSFDKSQMGKGPDLREQAKTLIDTLKSFGVEARILEVNKGPSITRFEIQPATGVKVSKITGLADDIAMNLAALSVRIEAPIPGKAAVGIEIPNQSNSIVRLREVIDSDAFKSFGAKTAFALGKDITGTPIVTDIAKMPHALIAGATGSGKSVCINSLITSIIYKADPKEVKFIMIDPKVVELSVYNGIPHLLIPVVTDPRKAAGALNWAVQEMTKRYKMFADNNVRDIKGYNELASLNGEKTLEQIIIIVDELADLMMVAPRDVEDAICRLAQMARAAGMHLVIATQRPSVDVITGVIKANVPSRIAFAVSSQIDSRTILDMGGAEKLLGKGDMLFLPMGASKPTRIQGAFISDKEVERIVEFVKNPDIKYDEDVLEKIESGVSGEKEPDGGDADELLPQAIEIVVEAGQASASLLQRRLKVGYSRAGRLIDQLEARGIVGPHEGAKPRQVLISRTEYAEMTMQM